MAMVFLVLTVLCWWTLWWSGCWLCCRLGWYHNIASTISICTDLNWSLGLVATHHSSNYMLLQNFITHWFLHATKFLRETLFNYNRIQVKTNSTLLSPPLSAPLFTRPKSILRVPNTGSTTRENNTAFWLYHYFLSFFLTTICCTQVSIRRLERTWLESLLPSLSVSIFLVLIQMLCDVLPSCMSICLTHTTCLFLPPWPSSRSITPQAALLLFLQAFLSGSRSKMCGDLQKCCAGIDDRFFAPN